MTSTLGSVYTPDVQRYVVQSSDVLSEHRLTVSPLADPSSVIWYTERYISHPPSGHPEIIENIVHSPTNTICWSVHRPTNIRRQGWYVRLRTPMFPPGVSIPMQPVGTTSPYYVDGALSFKCRTTAPPPPANGRVGTQNGRDRMSMSSVASSSSSSSSKTAVHSYPPTPAASSPPVPLSRPELPPLNVASHSSRTGKGRSLTGEGDGVYVIGLEDDPEHEREAAADQAKTPTSAATARPAKSPPLTELDIGNEATEEPLTPTHTSRPSQSSRKGKDPLSPVDVPPQPQEPIPNALPKRMPPPRQLPPSITEFILVPLSETASASCGPFVNLTPSVVASSPSPTTPAYPHSHHRTHSSAFPRNGPLANGASPNGSSVPQQRNSGMFGKALNLLKSTLPTSVTSSVAATWQGNSFTIVRVPEGSQPPPSGEPTPMSNGNGKGSLPPAYTSSANLLGTPGPSTNGSGGGAFDGWTPHAISSAAFVQPLPPPLLSFTDETSLFGPLPWVGFGSLLGASPFSSPLSSSGNGRRQTQSVSLPITSPTSGGASSSTALAPPFPIPSSSSSSSNPLPQAQQRGKPTPNYTTLGTLTVSTSQLASLGVDTAFWVTCALVFWGYLEEREGYLSANDD